MTMPKKLNCAPIVVVFRPRITLNGNREQSGFGIAYVLATIALLTAISTAMINTFRNAAQGEMIFKQTELVYSGAKTIMSRVRLCLIEYPATGAMSSASQIDASAITCPGYPSGSQNIWSGIDVAFLPVVGSIVSSTGWKYQNDGTTGVKILLVSNGSNDANTILTKVASRFSTGETSLSSPCTGACTLTLWVKK